MQTIEMPSCTETSAQNYADHRDDILYRDKRTDMQTIEMPSFYREACAQKHADYRDDILYRDKRTDMQTIEMPSFYRQQSAQRQYPEAASL